MEGGADGGGIARREEDAAAAIEHNLDCDAAIPRDIVEFCVPLKTNAPAAPLLPAVGHHAAGGDLFEEDALAKRPEADRQRRGIKGDAECAEEPNEADDDEYIEDKSAEQRPL